MADARLSISVSADAKQASAAFKDLAEDIKKVGGESVGVTSAVDRVDAALRKLASAPDTAGGLARATAKARIEVEDLRAELEKTPASAEKLKAIEAALRTADAAIEKTGNRAARLRDETEKLGQQMQVTAKGSEAMVGSFNSIQSVMAKMIDTGGATTQRLADIGFKALAVGEAFKFGYERGTEFNKFLQEHGNYLEKVIDATTNWAAGLKSTNELLAPIAGNVNVLLRAKQALAAEMKTTLSGLQEEMGGWKDLDAVRKTAIEQASLISKRYTQLKTAGKDWRSEVELQAPAINATATALAKLGIPLAQLPLGFTMAVQHAAQFAGALEAAERAARLTGDGIRGLRDTLENIPDNLGEFKVTEVIDGLAKAIESAKASGDGWNIILQDYAKEIDNLRDAAARAGSGGLDEFRKKILDLIPAYEAATIASGGITRGTRAFLDGISAQVEAIEEYRRAVNDADIATGQWLQNQQRMSNLSGQSTELMKAAEEQFRKTGQAIYTMTIMHLDWTKATEAQIDALRRMNESLNETWDGSGAGQKALDAIAQLVDLFKAGVLSLDGFNKNFAYLEEQLDRVIKAGGDLDGSLTGVLEALRKIANQIRMGPAGARPGATPGY